MGDALPFVDLGVGRTALQVTAGAYYSCALLDTHEVKCWGNGQYGKLGLGTTGVYGDAPGEMASLGVVNLGSGRTAKAIDGGSLHVCAILDDDSVKCWGWNFYGQLGQGDSVDRGDGIGLMGDSLEPVELPGHTVKAISAGGSHTCALLDNNQITCWGKNSKGQLGLGNTTTRGTQAADMATLRTVSLGSGRTAKAVSAGSEHTCAVLDDDSVKCWGGNDSGQLGLGDVNDRGITSGTLPGTYGATPLGTDQSGNPLKAKALAAGTGRTCAILEDDSLKCWGAGTGGGLGQGDSLDRGDAAGEMGNSLLPIDLGADRRATYVAAGNGHVCVVLDTGGVKCFGDNLWGSLGLGVAGPRGDGPNEMGDNLPVVDLGTIDANGACVAAPTTLPTDVVLDPSVSTDIAAVAALLYGGTTPPQRQLVGTINPDRVGIVSGRVLARDGGARIGCTRVTVVGRPEFGYAYTAADGSFAIAVEGGADVIVEVARDGYLPMHLRAAVPWRNYATLGDIELTAPKPYISTVVTSGAPTSTTLVGPLESDDSGDRTPRIIVPSNTLAKLPDNSTLSSYRVAVTEYTVGENRPEVMPAKLPSNSAYTYAVNLDVEGANGQAVTFKTPCTVAGQPSECEQPVLYYVDNFLNFPTGETVPSGYLNPSTHKWIASESGRVVKILGVDANGRARLDVTLSTANPPVDSEDTGTALTNLGITDAERVQLANTYGGTPKSVWRIRLKHFSDWDFNWPAGPPEDAEPPEEPDPMTIKNSCDQTEPDVTEMTGSLIGCLNQSLGESLPLIGTPYELVYRSSQQMGSDKRIRIPVASKPSEVPAIVKRIDLSMSVAGQVRTAQFEKPAGGWASVAPTFYEYQWDGRDLFNNHVNGSQAAGIRLSYVFDGTYQKTTAFGYNGNGRIQGSLSRMEFSFQQNWVLPLKHFDRWGQGLGGWSIDVHHTLDLAGQRIMLGNGDSQEAGGSVSVLETIAGTGTAGLGAEGIQATQSAINLNGSNENNHQVVVGADGTVYFTDTQNNRVRKISTSGVVNTVATFDGPVPGLAYGDGGLFVSERNTHKVWFVNITSGAKTLVAGTTMGFADGQAVTVAKLNAPHGLAYRDGVLYIADLWNKAVRKVVGGIVSTVAGTGLEGDGLVGGPALESPLRRVNAVAVGPDGTVYFAQGTHAKVYSVQSDGILRNFAGDGSTGSEPFGNGGDAVDANLFVPDSLVATNDGSVYIADRDHDCIRRVDNRGKIDVVAGVCGYPGNAPEGAAVHTGRLDRPRGVGVGPNGTIYVADTNNNRIRKIAQKPLTVQNGRYILPSGDGGKLFHFFPEGRHDKTTDSRTGATLYSFGYDTEGRVTTITDPKARQTTISYGDPVEISGPDGQISTLSLDVNGYLASFVNPAGEEHTFTMRPDGLMVTMKDAKANDEVGNGYTFDYDGGRLISDEDPVGAAQSLSLNNIVYGVEDGEESETSWQVTHSTALGRDTIFKTTRVNPVQEKLEILGPDGLTKTAERRLDQALMFESADAPGTKAYNAYELRTDGAATYYSIDRDPRHGALAPFLKSLKVMTRADGSGVEFVQSRTRSDTLDGTGLALTSSTETVTTNGRNWTTTFARNGGGTGKHRVTVVSPEGRAVVTEVNDQGQVTRRKLGDLDNQYFSYDSAGRLYYSSQGALSGCDAPSTSNSVATCRRRQLSYFDATPAPALKGYLKQVKDGTGRSLDFTRDLVGRLLTSSYVSSSGTDVNGMTWDANGNLTGVTPASQPTHSMYYTPVNLLESYVPPAAGLSSYSTGYLPNLDRQIDVVTRPDGVSITTQYDPSSGRVTNVAFSGGAVTGSIGTQYVPQGTSGAGRVSGVSGPQGTNLAFTYEGFLPASTTWSGSVVGSVSHSYNSDFQVGSEVVTPGAGTTVLFGYDNDGLLTCASKTNCTPASADALKITRDPDTGLVTQVVLGNVTETLTYNSYGELATQVAKFGGSTFLNTTYSPLLGGVPRDTLGRIVRKVEGSSTTEYVYDDRNRLEEVRVPNIFGATVLESYAYDDNGNRLQGWTPTSTRTGVYDDQDRLTSYGTSTFAYSANGELATRTNTSTGVTTTYTYDALGNLLIVATPGSPTIEYLVDGMGRRVGKKVGGTVTKRWLYRNQLNPIAELDGSGNLVARFVYGSRSNIPDLVYRGGNTYRVVSDHLGSPRHVVNVSNSSDTPFKATYTAFGEMTFTGTATADWLPFGFAGGLYDPATGLVRFGARDYDPMLGRWVSKDPIRFGGRDANLYAYGWSDPVNVSDYSGLLGDYLGWNVSAGSPWLPLIGAMCGVPLPSGKGVSVGIFKDFSFSTWDFSFGVYFAETTNAIDLGATPVYGNLATEAGVILKDVNAFKGSSAVLVGDLGPFAGNVSHSSGWVPNSVGGNVAVGPGAFAGIGVQNTSVRGASVGLSGVGYVH
jgi:RHS repeat-associated protein